MEKIATTFKDLADFPQNLLFQDVSQIEVTKKD